MGRSLTSHQPHDDHHHENKDQEGHGEADVESEVGGCHVAGALLLAVRVLEDGQVLAELRPARSSCAVLAGDVLPLAVPAPVGRGGLGAGPPPEGEAVRGAGRPGAPPAPVPVDGWADLGAGLLLDGGAVTAGAALDVDGGRRVAGPVSHLDTAATLDVTGGPGSPVSPAAGVCNRENVLMCCRRRDADTV